ncbi:MAG: AgmX/PglI C-terminal domain-containing protein [Kofleriaceae bacterium]
MRTFTLIAAAASLAACSRTGTGPAVRTDITARMQSIQGPIQQCYADRLQQNRKLRGMMVVTFRAAPGSGQFSDLTVSRDEPGDPALRQCVLTQVATLKLATPQRTAVTIAYPIDFQPNP